MAQGVAIAVAPMGLPEGYSRVNVAIFTVLTPYIFIFLFTLAFTVTINATDGSENSVVVMQFYNQTVADEFATFLSNAPSDAVGFTSGPLVGVSYAMVSYNGGVLCFAQGTKITTEWGQAPIETLAVGDMVLPQDKQFLPISWISSSYLSAEDLVESPKLRPIRIRAGALGDNLP